MGVGLEGFFFFNREAHSSSTASGFRAGLGDLTQQT